MTTPPDVPRPRSRVPPVKLVLFLALIVALGVTAWQVWTARRGTEVPTALEQRASRLREDLRKSDEAKPAPPTPPDPRADEPPSRNPRLPK